MEKQEYKRLRDDLMNEAQEMDDILKEFSILLAHGCDEVEAQRTNLWAVVDKTLDIVESCYDRERTDAKKRRAGFPDTDEFFDPHLGTAGP